MTLEDKALFDGYAAAHGADLGVNRYSRKPVVHLLRSSGTYSPSFLSLCANTLGAWVTEYEPDLPACKRCVAKARKATFGGSADLRPLDGGTGLPGESMGGD
jgi:hypothetical protein